jgi:hypothetical protein
MSWKYKFKKFAVKWRRAKPKDLELDEFQQQTYDTVIKFINDKDSILIPDSIGGRKCIVNNDVFISLVNNYIIIMNGPNYCKDRFDDRTRDDIIERFNVKINRKVNALESQSKNKIKSNLNDISKPLESPTQKD